MTPALGRALKEAVSAVTEAPLKFLILTHWHGDHFYGQPELRAPGVSAHPATFEALEQDGEAWFNGFKARFPEGTFKERPTLPEKQVPVSMDGKIDLGGMVLEMVHLGPGHTQGDLVVRHRESGTVAAGDLFFASRDPYTGDPGADFMNWERNMETILGWNPVHLVPGHGPLVDAAGGRAIQKRFREIRESVKEKPRA